MVKHAPLFVALSLALSLALLLALGIDAHWDWAIQPETIEVETWPTGSVG